ncbi:hypothetical protein K6V98_03970 [Collinsella sp. AGMB00827]|uniref:DUF202 domain-containing protein n=1 Tax=Collinsella ureilytica TaxID=2869515 RepID=A0ABS7MJG9_9ACTN|nr:hypothetical protein [Collinsella urealyticum]MBY4797514.1 hypothetical protein [Collinsella urealyticum]
MDEQCDQVPARRTWFIRMVRTVLFGIALLLLSAPYDLSRSLIKPAPAPSAMLIGIGLLIGLTLARAWWFHEGRRSLVARMCTTVALFPALIAAIFLVWVVLHNEERLEM